MENDNTFKVYANEFVNEVPLEHLDYLITLFMKEASVNMGVEVNKETLERTIYYVKKDYGFIPVNFIASGFVKGSLGNIGDGKGRLVPKTILSWLNQISMEYHRMMQSKTNKENMSGATIAYDLENYPVGSAIMKKIDWYRKGLLKAEDWDTIPLKDIAYRIKNNMDCKPENFIK